MEQVFMYGENQGKFPTSILLCYSPQPPQTIITNSVAWVHEQTIPTERPPLVGEVNANFCG
jgi:hypothetical protein